MRKRREPPGSVPITTDPAVTPPVTASEVNVPRLVMFGCAAVDRVPARVVAVNVVIPEIVERTVIAPASVIRRLSAESAWLRSDKDVEPGTILPTAVEMVACPRVAVPETDNDVRVPKLVILG